MGTMHDPIQLQNLIVRIVPGRQPNTPVRPGHVAVTYTFEIGGHVPMRDGVPARHHVLVEEGLMRFQDHVREMVADDARQNLVNLLAERPGVNPGIELALSLLNRVGESLQDPRTGVPDHELVSEAIHVLEGESDDPSALIDQRETGRPYPSPGYIWTLRNGLVIHIEKATTSLPRSGNVRVLECEVLSGPSGSPLAIVTLFEQGHFHTKYSKRGGEDLQRISEAIRALLHYTKDLGAEWF